MAHDQCLPFQRRHLPEDVGTLLRSAREARGTSRREVAVAIGIAARTLARIERGAQKPLWPTLDRLCDELKISASSVAARWVKDSFNVPSDPRNAPGLRLRALRRARGMTLVHLAKRSKVSAATLSRFERGLTASRLLARRVGGPEVAFDDRDVVLRYDRLAAALGLADVAAFHDACIKAAGTDGETQPR